MLEFEKFNTYQSLSNANYIALSLDHSLLKTTKNQSTQLLNYSYCDEKLFQVKKRLSHQYYTIFDCILLVCEGCVSLSKWPYTYRELQLFLYSEYRYFYRRIIVFLIDRGLRFIGDMRENSIAFH